MPATTSVLATPGFAFRRRRVIEKMTPAEVAQIQARCRSLAAQTVLDRARRHLDPIAAVSDAR